MARADYIKGKHAKKAPAVRVAEITAYDAVQLRAELCKRDFTYFIKTFWECVSADDLIWNWHIDYLADILSKMAVRVAKGQARECDYVINIPPGTTKSLLCSVLFPVWCWVNWHWLRFIVASYSGQLALEQAELSRELVRADKFRSMFPYLAVKRDKDTKSNFRIVRYVDNNSNTAAIGGSRFSTSVGGTLTGFHGHILIVDDPLDPNRAVSPVEIKSANRWMDQTLSTRKINKSVTPTILIMQRLHQDDPAGHILTRRHNVFHICLPGEIKNFREKVSPVNLIDKYQDDLLDPHRMPWTVLQDMQTTLGQYGYAGQVGQDPTPPGGGMFRVENFQIMDSMPNDSEVIQRLRYWDKAGTADGGAYTVGCKMCRLRSGKFIITDVKRGQWATNEREQIIRNTAEADGTGTTIYQEQEPGSSGKDSIIAAIDNLAGFIIYPDRPTGDKITRADPYSVAVNNGNVVLLHGNWNTDFIEEHRFFPFGTYKDQVDAAAGAFNKLSLKALIYDMWNYGQHVGNYSDEKYNNYIACVYATVSRVALGIYGYDSKLPVRLIKEAVFYDADSITDAQIAEQIATILHDYAITVVYTNPGTLYTQLCRQRKRIKLPVMRVVLAGKELEAIRFIQRLLHDKLYVMDAQCKKTIADYGAFQWDLEKRAHGVDVPQYGIGDVNTYRDCIVLFTHFYRRYFKSGKRYWK